MDIHFIIKTDREMKISQPTLTTGLVNILDAASRGLNLTAARAATALQAGWMVLPLRAIPTNAI